MNLLQQTLDQIEAEADKKSAIAIHNAQRICELDELVTTLRLNGADFVEPFVNVHPHLASTSDPQAITLKINIRSWQRYEQVLEALHQAELCFTTEHNLCTTYGETSLIHRIAGMSAYLECFNIKQPMNRAA